jgi:hypothetical protein
MENNSQAIERRRKAEEGDPIVHGNARHTRTNHEIHAMSKSTIKKVLIPHHQAEAPDPNDQAEQEAGHSAQTRIEDFAKGALQHYKALSDEDIIQGPIFVKNLVPAMIQLHPRYTPRDWQFVAQAAMLLIELISHYRPTKAGTDEQGEPVLRPWWSGKAYFIRRNKLAVKLGLADDDRVTDLTSYLVKQGLVKRWQKLNRDAEGQIYGKTTYAVPCFEKIGALLKDYKPPAASDDSDWVDADAEPVATASSERLRRQVRDSSHNPLDGAVAAASERSPEPDSSKGVRNSAQKERPKVSSKKLKTADAGTYQRDAGKGASPPAPPDLTTGSADASPDLDASDRSFDQEDETDQEPDQDDQPYQDEDHNPRDSAETELLPSREIGKVRIKAEAKIRGILKMKEGDPETPAIRNTIKLVTMFQIAKERFFGPQHIAEQKDMEAALKMFSSIEHDKASGLVAVAIRCWRLRNYEKSIKPRLGDHDHGFDRLWHSKNKSERISELINFLKKIDSELDESGFSVSESDTVPLLRTLFTAHELFCLGVECDDWRAQDSAQVLAKCFEGDPAFRKWNDLHTFHYKGATSEAVSERLKPQSDCNSSDAQPIDSSTPQEVDSPKEPNEKHFSVGEAETTDAVSNTDEQSLEDKMAEDVILAWLTIHKDPPEQQSDVSKKRRFVPPPNSVLPILHEALKIAREYTQENPNARPLRNPSPKGLEIVRAMIAGKL